jgi:hypothetical protein
MNWNTERKTKKAENFVKELDDLCKKHKVQIMIRCDYEKEGCVVVFDENLKEPHIDCLIEDCTIGSNPE